MKRAIYFLLISIFLCLSGIKSEGDTKKLTTLLPNPTEIEGWQFAYNPEEVEGDDLYLLIDGGAEIYHEYGFKRALAAEYRSTAGKRINIEIYQMFDSSSAYGIFSFKAGEKGKKAEIGNGAVIEDYYLNFYKSDIQVSITLLDTAAGQEADMIRFAEAISGKIVSAGDAPLLVRLIPDDGNLFHYPKYIKGYLALMNNIDLGLGNIFGFREGMIGKWQDGTVVLLKYENPAEAEQRFLSSSEAFKKSVRYSGYSLLEKGYSAVDDKGGQILVAYGQNFIVVIIGNSIEGNQHILDRFKLVIE
jgi:hypothetical protein